MKYVDIISTAPAFISFIPNSLLTLSHLMPLTLDKYHRHVARNLNCYPFSTTKRSHSILTDKFSSSELAEKRSIGESR